MEHNLAVLIDFENIATGTDKEGLGRFDILAVFRRLQDKGRIVVARSYADWGRFSRFKQTLTEQGVTMVELTSHGMQDKNRADIALVVDAMELAFTRDYIDTFVVLSGDSDFTPLVLRLKELNKRVMGIGTRGSTSKLIVRACDEFLFYDSLMRREKRSERRRQPRASAEQASSTLDPDTALALLAEAVEGLQQDAPGPVLASVVKAALLRKEPSFNESDLGFAGFGRFLEAAHKKKIVSIHRDGRSGGYRVDAAGSDGDSGSEPAARQHAIAVEPSGGLSAGASELRALLAGEGLDPLPRPMRSELVNHVVEICEERKSRRYRTNLHALRSGLSRWARKAPESRPSPNGIRAALRAMREAGSFMHADGTPIRSEGALLNLATDQADVILNRMNDAYLRATKNLGLELLDFEALAELLYGDPRSAEAVESKLASLALEHEVPEDVEVLADDRNEPPAKSGGDAEE